MTDRTPSRWSRVERWLIGLEDRPALWWVLLASCAVLLVGGWTDRDLLTASAAAVGLVWSVRRLRVSRRRRRAAG